MGCTSCYGPHPPKEPLIGPNTSLDRKFASRSLELGELLSGLSIGLGLANRVGAGVIAFQFLNYGLLGGPAGMLSHGIMTALVAIPVIFHSSRQFGIDKWLFARWPHARIW